MKSLSKVAIAFYEVKDYVGLNKLLSSISPMAAILINIEITLVNGHMTEEGNILSETLLPYIN